MTLAAKRLNLKTSNRKTLTWIVKKRMTNSKEMLRTRSKTTRKRKPRHNLESSPCAISEKSSQPRPSVSTRAKISTRCHSCRRKIAHVRPMIRWCRPHNLWRRSIALMKKNHAIGCWTRWTYTWKAWRSAVLKCAKYKLKSVRNIVKKLTDR